MANSFDVKVGKQITKRLELGDVTRDDVAFALGINVDELFLIESGAKRASADNLQILKDIFGVPLSYFYEDNDDDNTLH